MKELMGVSGFCVKTRKKDGGVVVGIFIDCGV